MATAAKCLYCQDLPISCPPPKLNRILGRVIAIFMILCVHFFPTMKNTLELWLQTRTIAINKDGHLFFPVRVYDNVVLKTSAFSYDPFIQLLQRYV